MIHTTTELLKFQKLQRRLRLQKYAAVGLLELLWQITGKQAPQGDIGKLSNEDLATLLDWEGDADELVAALVATGWIDESDEFRLTVHDWHEHAPNFIKGHMGRRIAKGQTGFCTYPGNATQGTLPKVTHPGKPTQGNLRTPSANPTQGNLPREAQNPENTSVEPEATQGEEDATQGSLPREAYPRKPTQGSLPRARPVLPNLTKEIESGGVNVNHLKKAEEPPPPAYDKEKTGRNRIPGLKVPVQFLAHPRFGETLDAWIDHLSVALDRPSLMVTMLPAQLLEMARKLQAGATLDDAIAAMQLAMARGGRKPFWEDFDELRPGGKPKETPEQRERREIEEQRERRVVRR